MAKKKSAAKAKCKDCAWWEKVSANTEGIALALGESLLRIREDLKSVARGTMSHQDAMDSIRMEVDASILEEIFLGGEAVEEYEEDPSEPEYIER